MRAALLKLQTDSMTASFQHLVRRAGACFTQRQQRCAAMRPVAHSQEDIAMQQVFAGTAGTGKPVVVSVWNKHTGSGIQT
jgi:hypothetical protein